MRIHDDVDAQRSAAHMDAHAFTVGNHVFLGPHYVAGSNTGRHLLAHEIAHVLQADAAGAQGGVQRYDGTVGGPAEAQAERMAGAVASGQMVSEAPIPATGVGRESAGDLKSMRLRAEHSVIPRLHAWSAAGLLDPPWRPPSVPAIPPLQITKAQADILVDQNVVAAGMLGLGPQAPVAPQLPPGLRQPPPPTAPPGRVPVPGQPPVTTPQPTGPGTTPGPQAGPRPTPIVGIGPVAAGAAVGIGILLWPSSTASPWLDQINPLTGTSASPQEHWWARRLTPEQLDYLRDLTKAERFHPEPDLEMDPDTEVSATPQPAPRATPDETTTEDKRRRGGCIGYPVPRRGGHKRHDAYATKVSKSPFDFYLRSMRLGLAAALDGKMPGTRTLWEVKVGFGFLLNHKYSQFVKDRVMQRFDRQRALQQALADACLYHLIWAIPNKWIASILTARWAARPVALAIPE